MRMIVLAAIGVVVGSLGTARAEAPCLCATVANAVENVYRRVENLVQSVGRVDEPRWVEIIRPPAVGIDPKMAVVPRERYGTLRIIPPPGTPGGDPKIEPR